MPLLYLRLLVQQDNCREVIASGGDGVAAIRSICCDCESPHDYAKHMCTTLKQAHSFQRGSCDPSALASGRPEGEVAVVVLTAGTSLKTHAAVLE
jgi:hypothetical protein